MIGIGNGQFEYRCNLISWYTFKKDSKILLIGKDSVALSVFFNNITNNLTCFSIDDDYNFDSFNAFFDYVIVYGGLEYAKEIIDCKDNTVYLTFLKKIKSLLEPDGMIFLATDNRLGLKFFAGAPETNTGNYFLGLRNFDDNDNIRTFSKNELIDMLDKAGFLNYNFLYPYPDYRYASEIFTDESVNNMGYGRPYKNKLNRRFELFNESKVANSMAYEGVMSHFANSFLIMIDLKKDRKETLEYLKLAVNRKNCFKIATFIEKSDDEKKVIKRAVDVESKKHIDNIFNNSAKIICDGINMLKAERVDKYSIKYDYLYSDNLDTVIRKMLNNNDVDGVLGIIDDFCNKLKTSSNISNYRNSEFQQIFGESKLDNENMLCMKPANIDLIFDNIYPDDESYKVIDGEWIFDIAVPTDFIIWRSLNELYNKNLTLRQIIYEKDIYDRYGITENDIIIYNMWNRHFTEEYVGVDDISGEVADSDILSLNDIRMVTQNGPKVNAHLNYNCNGSSENLTMYKTLEAKRDNVYKVFYELKNIDNTINLRFYPAVNRFYKCMILKIEGIENIIPIDSYKGDNDFDIFYTINGQYSIKLAEGAENISIEYELAFIEDSILDKYDELYNKSQQAEKNLNNIYNSRSWKTITKLGRIVKWRKKERG